MSRLSERLTATRAASTEAMPKALRDPGNTHCNSMKATITDARPLNGDNDPPATGTQTAIISPLDKLSPNRSIRPRMDDTSRRS